MIEYCICGHSKYYHDKDTKRGPAWENVCQAPMTRKFGERPYCYHEGFQLDNLAYIEQLAKRRKLL